MNTETALYWVQEAMKTAFMLAMPLLGVALAVGLIVSLLQAITSIQEMTLSFIPKLLAMALVLLLLAPWMLELLTAFTVNSVQYIPMISR